MPFKGTEEEGPQRRDPVATEESWGGGGGHSHKQALPAALRGWKAQQSSLWSLQKECGSAHALTADCRL